MDNDLKLVSSTPLNKTLSSISNMPSSMPLHFKPIDQQPSTQVLINLKESARKAEEQRQADINTANNTAEMKTDLKAVINNQNDHIAMLKEQNRFIKQVLNNIFGSSEDSALVQKEILRIMKGSKSTDEIIADKGLDIIVQMVLNAAQLYLRSKGILF